MKRLSRVGILGWTVVLVSTSILAILNVPDLIFSPTKSHATFTFDEELIGSALHEVGEPRVAVCAAPLKEIVIRNKDSLVSRLILVRLESANRRAECNKLVFLADSPPLEASPEYNAEEDYGLCPVSLKEKPDIQLGSKYVVELDVSHKLKSKYTDAMIDCSPSLTFRAPAKSTGFARQVLSLTLYMGTSSKMDSFPNISWVDREEEFSLSRKSVEVHNQIELLHAVLFDPRATSILEILNTVLAVIAGAGISILIESWRGVGAHNG